MCAAVQASSRLGAAYKFSYVRKSATERFQKRPRSHGIVRYWSDGRLQIVVYENSPSSAGALLDLPVEDLRVIFGFLAEPVCRHSRVLAVEQDEMPFSGSVVESKPHGLYLMHFVDAQGMVKGVFAKGGSGWVTRLEFEGWEEGAPVFD